MVKDVPLIKLASLVSRPVPILLYPKTIPPGTGVTVTPLGGVGVGVEVGVGALVGRTVGVGVGINVGVEVGVIIIPVGVISIEGMTVTEGKGVTTLVFTSRSILAIIVPFHDCVDALNATVLLPCRKSESTTGITRV
jgi:hypothetical protein